jgi:hypothetical protein
MAGFSSTRKQTEPKTFTSKRIYNQSALHGWQYSNKSALDIINEYQRKIRNGDWLSTEDRQKYKSAIDTYTSSGNSLREASKHYGQKYTADEEASWNNSLSSLQSGYNSINDFYGKFADDREYGAWRDWNTNNERFRSALDDQDFSKYVDIGKGVSNPGYYEAKERPDLFGWKIFGEEEPINNMVTFAEKNQPLARLNDVGDSPDISNMSMWINQYMSDEEKSIYNYYIGRGDKKTADEYLEFLDLSNREAQSQAQRFNDTPMELLYSFASGVESGVQGVENFVRGIVGAEGVAPSLSQTATSYMNEGNSGLWKVANDLTSSVGNMTPSLLVGSLTGGIGGAAVGKAVGSIFTGISSAGNAYAQMLAEGYGVDEARKYGVMVGAAEGGLNYLFGGIGKIGGKVTGNIISKAVDGIDNGIARFFVDFAINSTSEAAEEAAQSIFEPVFKSLATGNGLSGYENIDWSEVGYSAMLGALSAGILEGVPRAGQSIKSAYTSNIQYGGLSVGGAIQAAISKETKLADAFKAGQANVTNAAAGYANQLSEIDADNRVAKYVQGRIKNGKNVSGYQINRLGAEMESAIKKNDTAAIKTAVESRLTELGETGNVSAIADVIARQAAGEDISSKDKNIIKGSKFAERVANELNRDNIKSGEYSSAWAEGIGTKRVNADVYNLRRAMVDENTVSRASENAAPERVIRQMSESEIDENAKLIEAAASDKIGRIEGFTEETASAMVKGYDGRVSASEYITAFDEAMELGKRGASSREVTKLSENTGIGSALLVAYDAGLQARENVALEATKSENTVLKNNTERGIINTESEIIDNEGKTATEGIRLRDGGERLGGTNPEGQIRGLESRAGQNQEWREGRGRPADGEAARLLDEGRGREVRVADLGILNGSKQQKVWEIDPKDYTPDMKDAEKVANAQGLKLRVIVGDNLLIEEKNGSISGARAYVVGEYMIVRGDHEYYTSSQFARHEAGHDMIAKGEVDIKKVRTQIKQVLQTDEGIDEAAKHYEEAYSGTGLTADKIWEEMICDSLGDMNIFSKSKSRAEAAEVMSTAIPAIQQAVSETKTDATNPDALSEGKASRELDTEYLSAVNRGDMETAQRMVDEAAKEAGYTRVFYHGAKKNRLA